MDEVIEAIRVVDSLGRELTVYEYREYVPHLTSFELRRRAGRRRFVLDTGETVMRLHDEMFLIPATGEHLSRCR